MVRKLVGEDDLDLVIVFGDYLRDGLAAHHIGDIPLVLVDCHRSGGRVAIGDLDPTRYIGLSDNDPTANLLAMALELARTNPSYEDVASKFFEHFVDIIDAMNNLGGDGLWNDEDGFYYDQILVDDGTEIPLRVRSLVGIIPLLAVEVIDQEVVKSLPGFRKRMRWFVDNRPELAKHVDEMAIMRSLWTDIPAHEVAQRFMNTGSLTIPKPSWGSWTLYGLGTENQNMPGFITLGGKPEALVVGNVGRFSAQKNPLDWVQAAEIIGREYPQAWFLLVGERLRTCSNPAGPLQLVADAGGEAHSAEAVRFRIKQMIDHEAPDAILSDDAIVARLKTANIDIARRTDFGINQR